MEPALVNDPGISSILDELVRLEFDFHHPKPGTPLASLERMTACDFWEVGASGRRYSRNFALEELDKRRQHPGPEAWKYSDHHCRKLAQDIYLFTYTLSRTTDDSPAARQSGIGTQRVGRWCFIKAPSSRILIHHDHMK